MKDDDTGRPLPHAASANPSAALLEWRYELVPVNPLPILDLSKSLKSQFLPKPVVRQVDGFLKCHSQALFRMYLVSLALSMAVPLVHADVGSVAAICCFLCGAPLALASIATLRYDVVRLLRTKYDFWFYLCTASTTYLTVAAMLGDWRIARMLIDLFGIQNTVLIDAQMRGVRRVVRAAAIGILSIHILAVCVMLGRVDQAHNFSLLRYQSHSRQYNMTATDVVGNGLVTATILLLKIVYRKRKSFRGRATTVVGDPRVVECAIYRVSAQFSRARPARRANKTSGRNATSSTPKPPLEQMRFVSRGVTFDARNTVLPMTIRSEARFPFALLVILCVSGVGGAVCISVTVALVVSEQHTSTDSIHQCCGVLALSLTAIFTIFCTALNQRQLLKSLVKSFDFAFNALQLVSMHACICVLYDDWSVTTCVAGASLLWTYWILTLDVLTPVMKTKLGFHIRFAIPVVVLSVLWHCTLLYHILGGSGPLDRVMWEGELLTHHLQIRIVPFYISRLATLTPWFMRILWRLLWASNVEAIVLRGSVTYQDRSCDSQKHYQRRMARTISQQSNRIAPASVPTRARVPQRDQFDGVASNDLVVPYDEHADPG